MQNVKKILKEINDSFLLDDKGVLYFKNNVVDNNFFFETDQRKNQLVKTLTDILYQNFYLVTYVQQNANFENTEIGIEDFFHKALFDAYNPPPTVNKGWQVFGKENNGITYFQKQNHVVRMNPGQFALEYDTRNGEHLETNYYSVLNPPQRFKRGDYFHYVYGATPNIGNDYPVVRFYFNLHADGAPVLIKLLTRYFNLFNVPFSFKCCSNRKEYRRSDSAVLYVGNHLFAISIQLLEKIIAEIKNYLKKETPLFALRLADGFSFAENPNSQMSFGQSRCNIIAEGLIENFQKNVLPKDCIDNLLKKFTTAGLNLNALHLNAGSTFPYDFTLATFE